FTRVPGAESDVGVGCEVEHEVRTPHGFGECGEIEQVAAHQTEGRRLCGGLQEFGLTGGEVVEADDLMTIGEQAVYEVTADKAGGSGDERFQVRRSCPPRVTPDPARQWRRSSAPQIAPISSRMSRSGRAQGDAKDVAHITQVPAYQFEAAIAVV